VVERRIVGLGAVAGVKRGLAPKSQLTVKVERGRKNTTDLDWQLRNIPSNQV